MKKEIEISNPKRLLSCICAPFMAAIPLEFFILVFGFTPYLLFVNYLIEVLFLYLFFFSYKSKYKCYKEEPNLKITKYFWVELAIHCAFIIAAVLQSAFNVWLVIGSDGSSYRHDYYTISAIIVVMHIIYLFIDYYASEKAAAIRYCRKAIRKKANNKP